MKEAARKRESMALKERPRRTAGAINAPVLTAPLMAEVGPLRTTAPRYNDRGTDFDGRELDPYDVLDCSPSL